MATVQRGVEVWVAGARGYFIIGARVAEGTMMVPREPCMRRIAPTNLHPNYACCIIHWLAGARLKYKVTLLTSIELSSFH